MRVIKYVLNRPNYDFDENMKQFWQLALGLLVGSKFPEIGTYSEAPPPSKSQDLPLHYLTNVLTHTYTSYAKCR